MSFFSGWDENSADLESRLKATEEITDEHALKDIFINDSSPTVRIKALGQIKDTDFLFDECLNNPSANIRMACLNHIIDSDFADDDEINLLLKCLTLNDPDTHVRRVACENLDTDNQDVFSKIAKSDADTTLRRQAILKITDENLLRKFAFDEDKFIRLEAILNPNLTDPEVLASVILKDDDEFNRYCACGRISDEDSFLEIIHDPSMYPRLAELSKNTSFSLENRLLDNYDEASEYEKIVALNFITDESFLESIVLNQTSDNLRLEAIKNRNFTSQEILKDIIKTETNPDVLLEAVKKLEDESLLADYVKKHPEGNDVVLRAISKIADHDFLVELSENDNSKIRLQTVKRMSELRNTSYFYDYDLHEIALKEKKTDIRLEAISGIVKRNDLIDIADKLSDRPSRLRALNKITADKLIGNYISNNRFIAESFEDSLARNRLNRMALYDEDGEIRKAAASKLNDKHVLDEIASNDLDDEVRDEAQKRLDSLWEDIKIISSEERLKEIYSNCFDEDIQRAVKNQIDDLKTWKIRIGEISEIDDIDELKEIAQNDYNYYVRCEAQAKLESLLFDIRLDEFDAPENIEKLKKIALDESFSQDIRNRAFSMLK